MNHKRDVTCFLLLYFTNCVEASCSEKIMKKCSWSRERVREVKDWSEGSRMFRKDLEKKLKFCRSIMFKKLRKKCS